MKSRSMISLAAATGLLDAIAAAGGTPDRVLSKLGLERSIFANPDGFIASTTFARLLEVSAEETGDECFGLHFGERLDPRDVGALVYIVLNAPTVAAAMHSIERYLHLHNEATTVKFSIEGRHGNLRYLLTGLTIDSIRQQNEFSMAVILKTFRIIAGKEWKPREVQFAHQGSGRHLRALAGLREPYFIRLRHQHIGGRARLCRAQRTRCRPQALPDSENARGAHAREDAAGQRYARSRE